MCYNYINNHFQVEIMYSKIDEMYKEMKFRYDLIFKLVELITYLILQVCIIVFIVKFDNPLTILYMLIPAFFCCY